MTPSSFEAIYIKYYAGLMTYGKVITVNKQMIEDAIQEIFLDFWKNNHDLDSKHSLENYLFVCFRNRLIKKLNSFKIVELKFDIPDTKDTNPYLALEETLGIFINQLPTHQKEVIYLRYYKDKSYQEIADILGIKYQVARNFSYRGIKSLKDIVLSYKNEGLSKAL